MLYKPFSYNTATFKTFTDWKKLMTKSIFLILEEQIQTTLVYSDFGDTSEIFLTKALWIEKNEIVYLESWALSHGFDKL